MIYLQKGKFYGKYSKNGRLLKTYIVGGNVPCIANVCSCVVNKDGTLEDKVDAIY